MLRQVLVVGSIWGRGLCRSYHQDRIGLALGLGFELGWDSGRARDKVGDRDKVRDMLGLGYPVPTRCCTKFLHRGVTSVNSDREPEMCWLYVKVRVLRVNPIFKL